MHETEAALLCMQVVHLKHAFHPSGKILTYHLHHSFCLMYDMQEGFRDPGLQELGLLGLKFSEAASVLRALQDVNN